MLLAGSPVQMRADVVQLAVIPAGPAGLFQVPHRDAGAGGEAAHLAAEPVADLLEQGRTRVVVVSTRGNVR
jgi:hypothetical protein